MTFPLIGLTGKKRSGKDSFAATLVEEFGFQRFAFADPLKSAALGVDPWVLVDENGPHRLSSVVRERGWEEAKEIREVRRTLQNFGVEIREIEEDFWLDATMVPALDALEDGPVVITDVRFPNEARDVQDFGTLVRVNRPGLDSGDTHASETALDDYEADFQIWNIGSLEDLAGNARLLARRLY